MESYIVETRNLKKYYQQGVNTVKALDGVDFRVKAEEFVAIIGKSGSGKSTLLRQIACQYSPEQTSVYIMDFGSMALKLFEGLNHVGGVALASEDEKIKNLLKLLKKA